MDQHGDGGLEAHAIPAGFGVLLGLADALQGVVHGDLQGAGQVLAVHQSTHAGRGEDIAGAVEAHGEFFVEVAGIAVGGRVIGHGTDLARLEGDAGQHGGLAAQAGQVLEELFDVGLVIVVAHVVDAQHEGGLGQVGNDDIGLAAQLAHLLGKFRGEAGVEHAVVRHGGVGVDQGAVAAETVEELAHQVDLLEGAQVAGVDGVKMDVLVGPVVRDGVDLLGQVVEGEVFEAAGVGGEHHRGQRHRLDAHDAEHRQDDRQTAAPHTGKVMDAENFFRFRYLQQKRNLLRRICLFP